MKSCIVRRSGLRSRCAWEVGLEGRCEMVEPPTKGKVRLFTSLGELDVELWSNETEDTCKIFLSLCAQG